MKNNKLSIVLRGLIAENPVLVLVLGTCPTLAQTGNVIAALSMGIAATIVLVCSNMVISALRNIIPDTVRIPCYIVVIAGFVTVVQLVMQAYLPDLYEMMGVYLALIVVNCIILGRAEMFARKNNVVDSALDGLGMGLGFLLALLVMATIREVLGAGTFAGIEIPFLIVRDAAGVVKNSFTLPILTQAPGGFLVFGIMIAVINKIGPKKGEEKRKNFSCEGCPSATVCGRVACPENTELVTESDDRRDGGKEEA
ncbi:MAG: electron transport complex subunit RsxE [Clostridia bacterium]|nr:electron transport complex subunit RsxE [Clostridia bacterium]